MATVENLIPFKPGEDSRRGVKPKGVEHSRTRLKRLLQLTQNLKNPVTGEMEGFSVAEQMDMQQIIKARKGDTKAYSTILDRLEGKPAQTIDQTIDVTSQGESIAVDPAMAAEFTEWLKQRKQSE